MNDSISMGKQVLTLIFTALSIALSAQEIGIIKSDQLLKWKENTSDTVYVLNFWATWCSPCVAELPVFEKLDSVFHAQPVAVVLISNDFKKTLETRVKPFVIDHKLKSKVVLMGESDPNSWINLVSPDWSGALPATLIISKRKNKTLFFEKPLTYAALEAAVRSVL